MELDKLATALEDFQPWSGNEEQTDLLVRWTKYERLPDTFPVSLGDGIQVVAVVNPFTSGVALVLRTFEEAVDLGGGKTFNRWAIEGIRPTPDADEAENWLRDIRNAYDERVASEIGGFGEADESIAERRERQEAAVKGMGF